MNTHSEGGERRGRVAQWRDEWFGPPSKWFETFIWPILFWPVGIAIIVFVIWLLGHASANSH